MSGLSSEDWELFSRLRERLQPLDKAGQQAALEEMRQSTEASRFVSLLVLDLAMSDAEPIGLTEGDLIDNLLLGPRLGAGGMGVVYEAEQQLGKTSRRVAVKFIRPELVELAEEDVRRRFDEEVDLQARLQYDGIARLYDTGTYTDPTSGKEAPYLVMELIRGALPITRFAGERGLAVEERLALFQRVCRAIQYAHDHRIVHRDLKPGNILVDSDGRPFVVDFGLAQTCDAVLQGGARLTSGTPAYMSPEQISDDFGPISEKTDCYSLGVILYELLTGERPYASSSANPLESSHVIAERAAVALSSDDTALRGELEAIVSAALARQPTERISVSTLRAWIGRFLESAAPHSRPGAARIASVEDVAWTGSPYPGLAAFTPDQAPVFFGRSTESELLRDMLLSPEVRLVAVAGVSGSGKSSLVMAGLLPLLRKGTTGGGWIELCFKPAERGADPLLAVAHVLKSQLSIGTASAATLPDANEPSSPTLRGSSRRGIEGDSAIKAQTGNELARALQADPSLASGHVQTLLSLADDARNVLVVIDQFEELFTQADADRIAPFLAWLDTLLGAPEVRVVITLRADFFDRAVSEPVLAQLLRRAGRTFPLDPPGTGALYEMIVRPAELAGVELERGLAQRLLDDAGTERGAMALLALSLDELYERGAGQRLTLADYEAFGGVKGAVQQRADAALRGLPAASPRALRSLIAQLVEVNREGVATGRRASQATLNGDALSIAIALTEARLLVSSEGQDGQPTVEVAHETVLSAWTPMGAWIEDHKEALRARRDVERAAAEWIDSGRPRSALCTGRVLRRYLGAAAPISPTAQAFLVASRRKLTLGRVTHGVLAVVGLAMLAGALHISRSDYPPLLATRALLLTIGVWPVQAPDMVQVPAGDFRMGDLHDYGAADERPVHQVRFAAPFEIGRFEVTFDEYDLFAAATGRVKPNAAWGQNLRGDRPVINVSWNDAVAYAEWLSMHTGRTYRLPTEAEWEYAARAGTETDRHWGDSAGGYDSACAYANVFDRGNDQALKQEYLIKWDSFACEDGFQYTAPAASFEPNPWQIHDMLGNVWEWVQDCYATSYDAAPSDGSATQPADPDDCRRRVVRGGSMLTEPASVRSAERGRNSAGRRAVDIGFRLARSVHEDAAVAAVTNDVERNPVAQTSQAMSNSSVPAEPKARDSYQAYPPGSITVKGPGAVDYARLSAEWWRWARHGGEVRVMNDETGNDCALNQPDGNVWFLAGTQGPGVVTRKCTIPPDRSLFFPLLNILNGCPFPNETMDDIREGLLGWVVPRPSADPPYLLELNAAINGVPVESLLRDQGAGQDPDLFSLRTQSNVFSFGTFDVTAAFLGPADVVVTDSVSEEHSYYQAHNDDDAGGRWDVHNDGYPEYTCPDKFVGDGYYVYLDPLPPGKHTLRFGVTVTVSDRQLHIDVTYHLQVDKEPAQVRTGGSQTRAGH